MKGAMIMLFFLTGAPIQAQNTPRQVTLPAAVSDQGKQSVSTISDASRRILQVTQQRDDGWSFTLEPYLWGLGMSGSIGVKGFGPVDVDFSPRTIFNHLDWGVMARGEIRKDRWGLLGDGFFAQLSAEGNPPVPLYKQANLKVYQGMASLALAYRIFDSRQGFFDIYAGARFNYMQFNFGGEADSSGIQQASNIVVQKISTAIGERVTEYLVANSAAIKSEIQQRVQSFATEKVLTAVANNQQTIHESLSPVQVARIMRDLQKNGSAYGEFLSATAEAKAAQTKNQLTAAIRQRASNAQKKLARVLAKKIEAALPTAVEGDQGWVDPIIGLRGQVNFTRWLFLAVQGDVGGFGAGSDIAWMAQASVGCNFTRHIFWEAGYRYFYMDYENDGAIYKAAELGVFSGVGIKF